MAKTRRPSKSKDDPTEPRRAKAKSASASPAKKASPAPARKPARRRAAAAPKAAAAGSARTSSPKPAPRAARAASRVAESAATVPVPETVAVAPTARVDLPAPSVASAARTAAFGATLSLASAEPPRRAPASSPAPPPPPPVAPASAPAPAARPPARFESPLLPEADASEWVPLGAPEDEVRAIPPIPEEADEFEPITEELEEGPPHEPPPGATPKAILDAVRWGRLHVSALSGVSDSDLAALALQTGLAPRDAERRADLLYRLLQERPPAAEPATYFTEGLLDLLPDGFGFLRRPDGGYAPHPGDAYVSPTLVRRHGLRTGHWVSGTARGPRPGETTPALLGVEEVNHEDPDRALDVVPFDRLVVTHPDQRYLLETEPDEPTGRLIDLFCPLGRGQRALVVSPPRAGKTIVLQKIADALARNSPEVEIVVLLVDERPEEVTNMRRSVRGEVIASTFDQAAHRHIRLVELVMEKVKRMVEYGRHVVLLVDSLTRIGRAYNNESHGVGRLLTGGLEASALVKPKRIFGAARNVEHGGSLTIVATALVDTGSRLDQVIFEEFKGSGNLELVLDRDLANQRLWPAIDIPKSGTRKEELLLHPEEQRRIVALRRQMSNEPPAEVLTDLLQKFEKYRTNAEFLMHVEA